MTAHGATIGRFKPGDERQRFHTLEINTEEGEALGYLNMVYLRRNLPCYYLVYVEVLSSFRGLGLGQKILKAFMEFVREKKALGLLDNIIPPAEPTYEIYRNLGWKNVKEYVNGNGEEGLENYMVFVPESVQTETLKKELVRILFLLKKKRPVIDMHDNEDMVKRTIEEFRSVHKALLQLFDKELSTGTPSPLMHFMFTRLAVKLLGFRRRITTLIGYTGGESLEQISLADRVKGLPIQPYSLWNVKNDAVEIHGEKQLLRNLPEDLRKEPTFFIEDLPLYERPYLRNWIKKKGTPSPRHLKIADILDLGFDPTRLREFRHEGIAYIFERISPHFFPSLVRKWRFLKRIGKKTQDLRFHGTAVQINPPLLIFRDKGNIYVLRKKVEGIHSDEALDQLKTALNLREMNHLTGIDRALMRVINEIRDQLRGFSPRLQKEVEDLTYFIPWDIEKNMPRIQVDDSGISLGTLWIA
jgi:GNAT superfamily N-acetyltransferase